MLRQEGPQAYGIHRVLHEQYVKVAGCPAYDTMGLDRAPPYDQELDPVAQQHAGEKLLWSGQRRLNDHVSGSQEVNERFIGPWTDPPMGESTQGECARYASTERQPRALALRV